MDDLIKMVMQKADISELAANLATQTVVDYLSEKLPAPAGGMVKGFLGGKKADDGAGLLGGAGDMLKGLMG